MLQNLKTSAGAAALQRDIPYLFSLYTSMANEAAYHTARIYTMPVKARRVFIWKKITSMQPVSKIIKDAWKVLKVVWG